MSNVVESALEQQIKAAKRLKAIKRARESLLAFIRFIHPDPEHEDDPDYSTYEETPVAKLLCEVMEKVERGELLRVCVSIPPQFGKELSHSTPMLTPSGWTTHGSLKPGDMVYGGNGLPVRVVAVSEDCDSTHEIEFVDGQVIRCHANHEWLVHCNDRLGKPLAVMETKEMERAGVWIGERGKRGSRARFSVDWVAIRGESKQLPIEPYALGAWLGDGTSTSPCISFAEEDRAVAEAIDVTYPRSSCAVHKTTGVRRSYHGGGLHKALRTNDLLSNKHIPVDYLTASFEQRRKLLAGLMDTDGYIHHPTQRAQFSTVSRRLADDFATLIGTFGMRATICEVAPSLSSSGIQGKRPVFQVTFSPTIAIDCVLPRKATSGFVVKNRRRGIVSIRRCDPEPGRCIQVENDDGIYLAGRGLVPTHNSTIISRAFPAWCAGRAPHKHLMLGTYSQDFAEDFGGEVRNIMQSNAFRQVFPHFGLRKGEKAKDTLVTTKGGKINFLGRGGAGTGKPADTFIVDDPIKDDQEAQSAATRKTVKSWFSKVSFSRIHKFSPVVIVHTRWHEDDLIGWLVDPSHPEHNPAIAKKWTYINIPAVVTEQKLASALGLTLERPTDPDIIAQFGDRPMASLWENRKSLKFLAEACQLDKRGFYALYMGQPAPEDGDYFKAADIVGYSSISALPRNIHVYGASDHALTTDEENDATCLGCFGVDENDDIWIYPDLFWERVETDETLDAMMDRMKRHKPMVWWAEDEHINKSLGPFRRKRMMEEKVYCTVDGISPGRRDLKARARSIQGRIQMRKVHFPTFAPWWQEAKNEMMKFPNATHDDFVSFLALIGLGLSKEVAAAPEKKTQTYATGTFGWFKARSKLENNQARLKLVASGK